MVGDPSPGSVYLTSDPPLAPYAIVIRENDIGGPSNSSVEFAEGEEVIIDDWQTLPIPETKAIHLNGQDCQGTYAVRARFETDLLLTFDDEGSCRIEVLGMHPRGAPHVEGGE